MKVTNETKIYIPYSIVIAGIIPIFIISFLFPSFPITEFDIWIDNFIDNYLLGRVGLWSSLHPLRTKIIANYVNIFGPVFCLVISFLFIKKTTININELEKKNIYKNIFGIMIILLFDIGFVCINYFLSSDFMQHRGSFLLFGKYILFFTIPASIWFLSYSVIISLNFLIFSVFHFFHFKNNHQK
ncbi:hypothetical protein Ppb6_00658 [Photorhabdus australis subsp. thailandensis]|uniref:Colicin immunity protein n=1 Tax=Photorhabdus australis subsp. thailandensis TaxID=2805096 RepID=A0A1C0U848_9GAMM|nr:hypothetical protein [Photorhabdus australis]OCQ54108.1 hypothetical protein Ppb6_00658 [Photorhabdus australis subsp. thailandensis]